MEYLIIIFIFLTITIFMELKYKLHTGHTRKECLIITLIIFIIRISGDYYATFRGHRSFTGSGLIGLRIFGLPIEEYLF